jgi:hypothetical protein
MNKWKNILCSQFFIFAVSLVIFFIAAAFGWEKLRFGFDFVDEGYHMTEAWRLTVGDRLFQGHTRGATNLSPLINSMIFRMIPDLTLLGFRRIQYILTILSLLLLGTALYRINKQYWYQPLIFSIFAFTGSEPIGMFPDLNYYTYAHLFVTLHLSFLLIGFYLESKAARRFLLAVSGFFLWLISFNLLHTGLVLLSPLLCFYLLRKTKTPQLSFEAKDLFSVLLPVLLCWILFVGVFNISYLKNVVVSLRLMFSSASYAPGALFYVSFRFLECVCVSAIFLATFLFCLSRFRTLLLIPAIFALSLAMYFIMDTSLFNLLYLRLYSRFYSVAMWFAAVMTAVFAILFCHIAGRIMAHRPADKTEVLATLMMIPCALLSISMSVFSLIGACNVLYSSIPVVGCIGILILSLENVRARSYFARFIILLIFFAPFYYSTAWSVSRHSGYDVSPAQVNAEITEGVGRGIRTNAVYARLYDWIRFTAGRYTTKDDFIISYVVSPMVHMITKRRPALGESWIDLHNFTPEYLKTAITHMEKSGRDPKIVFIFDRRPALLPVIRLQEPIYFWWKEPVDFGLKQTVYLWSDQEISAPSSDPISQYVAGHMHLVDTLRLYDDVFVYCFLRNE